MANTAEINATTDADEGRLDLRTAQLIAGTVSIITEDFGLRDYEGEHLAFVLSEPNFFEFWFSGRTHGSFKVFLDYGIPFVWDQHRNARVEETNAKIRALFHA